MNYKLHWTTPAYLQQVRAHEAPYLTEVCGLSLSVFPNVMSPLYDWSGQFHVECLPDLAGKRVLELGCGSGIISVCAAIYRRAHSVLAVDINPEAVANTSENIERHNLQRCCKAVLSDLFENVYGAFDFVVFNLPYHGCNPSDFLDRGVMDGQYEMQTRFFMELKAHLNANASVHIGFSSSGNKDILMRNIQANGLSVQKFWVDERQGYDCAVYELVSRRY
jgi:methylase of polypeptide subunit release factors